MPPSLRKACHTCVAAKRKCNPQLPACDRCIKRQISCVYDLEPITHSEINKPGLDRIANNGIENNGDDTQQFHIVYDSVPNARDASASAMASGLSSDSPAAHPLLTADGETTVWLLKWFTQVAQDGVDGNVSPFVHSRVIDGIKGAGRFDVSRSCLQKEDAVLILAEICHLINRALHRLLIDKPSIRRDFETEQVVQRLFSTAHSLWSTADTLDLRHLGSYDAWSIAESIRRSMFAAIFVRGIWSVASSGYCHYEPFLESMPFDPRAGLWEAETEAAWSTIIDERYQSEHTQLKSWHEFTEDANSKHLSHDEDGRFQRMLYVSFHGSNGIRWLDELDQQRPGKMP